jgi:hypothetical protein
MNTPNNTEYIIEDNNIYQVDNIYQLNNRRPLTDEKKSFLYAIYAIVLKYKFGNYDDYNFKITFKSNFGNNLTAKAAAEFAVKHAILATNTATTIKDATIFASATKFAKCATEAANIAKLVADATSAAAFAVSAATSAAAVAVSSATAAAEVASAMFAYAASAAYASDNDEFMNLASNSSAEEAKKKIESVEYAIKAVMKARKRYNDNKDYICVIVDALYSGFLCM